MDRMEAHQSKLAPADWFLDTAKEFERRLAAGGCTGGAGSRNTNLSSSAQSDGPSTCVLTVSGNAIDGYNPGAD
jgi:hypothetical protein